MPPLAARSVICVVVTLIVLGGLSPARTQSPTPPYELLQDIAAGEAGSYPRRFTALGDKVFFTATDTGSESGDKLWVTDGTAQGTHVFANLPARNLVVAGNLLYFSSGGSLWATDGASMWSLPAQANDSSDNGTDRFVAHGGLLYFEGQGLWVSDGSPGGTQAVKPDLNFFFLTPVGNDLLFVAWSPQSGWELWRTDGTSVGTAILKDIAPGPQNGHQGFLGFRMVSDGAVVYFQANDGVSGSELWRSDGTAAGTQLVADIVPGADSSNPTPVTIFNGIVYFEANDGVHGDELWRSDGTPEGTWLLKDLFPGPDGGGRLVSDSTAVLDSQMYFTGAGPEGAELWRTDGTTEGTVLVADLRPEFGSQPTWIVEINDRLYFAADTLPSGRELWTSDGTAAGTMVAADIIPGPNSGNPHYITVLNGRLYFQARPPGSEFEPFVFSPGNPPVAHDQTLVVSEDTSILGLLTANDPDGDPLTFSIVTNGTLGTAAIGNPPPGAFSYRPHANQFGTDSFTFQVSDGAQDSNVATVLVTITPVNDAPVAVSDSIATQEDAPISGRLLASDVEGGTLTYSVVTNSNLGTVAITNPATGDFTFTPFANVNGPSSFTFRASDGVLPSNVATVGITVAPLNDSPLPGTVAVATQQGVVVTGKLTATDIDNDPLSFVIDAPASMGIVTVLNPATGDFSYAPNNGAIGYDSFKYKVSDGKGGTAIATASVIIVANTPQWPGQTVGVNVASNGAPGNKASFGGAIGADGRYVAFTTNSVLHPADTNLFDDIYIRDRLTGTTELISVPTAGGTANGSSVEPGISADGRFVAFRSLATNLVPGDTNNMYDVFVRDRFAGTTTRVNVSSSGAQALPPFGNLFTPPSISADGRFVAFTTLSSNLVPGDTNGRDDVFLHDRTLGRTERVSVSSANGQSNDTNFQQTMTSDGRFIAYASRAIGLVGSDTNGQEDVFLRDRMTGQTSRVSLGTGAVQLNGGPSVQPTLSEDGRFVAFASASPTVVSGDTNGTWDVFVRDRVLDVTQRISLTVGGGQGNAASDTPFMSADGRYVAFRSYASNLIGSDSNSESDIYVVDRFKADIRRVSVTTDGTQGTGSGVAWSPRMSADGRFVAFETQSANLSGTTTGMEVMVVGGVGVSPASASYSAASGAGSIDVSFVYPGTPWSATTGAPFVSITGPTGQSGNGKVDYVVAPNLGAPRTGTMTVALQPVTISQASNAAPVAFDGNVTSAQSGMVSGTLSATDVDGPSLTYFIVLNGANGVATITDAAAGTFSYAPGPLGGSSDAFTFQVSDGIATSNIATVTITYLDTTAPSIAITQPSPAAIVARDAIVPADYACTDNGSGVASCVGSVPAGEPIDTTSTGTKNFTVTASDAAGNASTRNVTYTVVDTVIDARSTWLWHQSGVQSRHMAIFPDGTLLATTTNNMTLPVIDPASGAMTLFPGEFGNGAIGASPNPMVFATPSETYVVGGWGSTIAYGQNGSFKWRWDNQYGCCNNMGLPFIAADRGRGRVLATLGHELYAMPIESGPPPLFGNGGLGYGLIAATSDVAYVAGVSPYVTKWNISGEVPAVEWSIPFPATFLSWDFSEGAITANGGFVVARSGNHASVYSGGTDVWHTGELYAIAADGSIAWEQDALAVTPPVIGRDHRIYVGALAEAGSPQALDVTGAIRAYDHLSGKPVWTQLTPGVPQDLFVGDDRRLYALIGGTSEGRLVVLDPHTGGVLLAIEHLPKPYEMLLKDGVIYVTGDAGVVALPLPPGFAVRYDVQAPWPVRQFDNQRSSYRVSTAAIAIAPATATVGESLTVSARMTAASDPVRGAILTLLLFGTEVGSGTTDDDGTVTFDPVSIDGQSAGVHESAIEVHFDGSIAQDGEGTFLDPASSTASLVIQPAPIPLSIVLAGTGAGSVTSSPVGITCPSVCDAAFQPGTVVELTPLADANSTFTGWTGACTGTGTCTVTMNVAQSVTATFTATGRDLVVIAISDPPPSADPGSSFSVTATTANQGTLAAGLGSITRFYLSLDGMPSADDLLFSGTLSVSNLAAGASATATRTLTISSTTPPGTFLLLACADDTARIAETHEQNNCAAAAGTVTINRADLTVTMVNNPPSAAAPGTSFTIGDTTANEGTLAVTVTTTTRYFLSLDTERSPDDVVLTATRSVAALAAGASSSGTRSTSVPDSTTLGTYYVLACADDQARVIETNENNNCRASATTIVITRPDLATMDVSVSTAAVMPTKAFAIVSTVANFGTVDAAASTERFYLSLDGVKDDTDLLLTGNRSIGILAPGEAATASKTVTVSAGTPLGSYVVIACADNLAKVIELSEGNNCKAALTPIKVTLPDLVQVSVSNPPAVIAPGGSFSATDTVTNLGGIAATATSTRYYLSVDHTRDDGDHLLNNARSVGGLAVEATNTGTRTVSVPTTVPAGTYYLIACADANGAVAELDETNNCVASAITGVRQ